jgi:TonB-dependent starch-binding outer membrane protein SusC
MKRFTNYLFLSFLVVLLPSMLLAQRTITGKITDAETGETLISASVVVDGTTTGTSSDAEGKYAITLPAGSSVLVFSYTGYTTQKITVNASNILDVALVAGDEFQEVLVVGYGEIKKEDATGSIASISQKDFNQGAITSVQDLFAGKLAGVSITPSVGPGGGAGITIRGLSSIGASNDPLFVIDGVPLEDNNTGGSRNPFSFINPNDIENITVLKDASAAAIYGSRASGGVILITTKKGKGSDKFRINYTGNLSSDQVIQTVDVLTADEFRTLVQERDALKGTNHAALLGDANTDWQSEIFQNGIGTDHNVNLSGGIEKLPYRLSLGYTNKNGVLKTDQFARTTAALNLNPSLLNNTLQFNLGAKLMMSSDNFADQGVIGAATRFDPTQPVTSDDALYQNRYGGYFAYTNASGEPLGLAPTNPVAILNLKDDVATVRRYVLNGSVDYRFSFLPELRANLNLAHDNYYGSGTVTEPFALPYTAIDTGRVRDYSNTNTNDLLEFYLNYAKDFNFGKLDVVGGYSWQHLFFDNDFSNRSASGRIIEEESSPREYYLVSLYGRLNYTLQDKYYFSFVLRRDGSSRFSPATRWGLFPSASFAYKVFENKEGTINHLKLRLGTGTTGQQDIGDSFNRLYPYLPIYNASQPTARYQFGNEFFYVLRPEGYDANLKWEETTTYNIGLDYGLFNNKVSGSLDVYRKNTIDILNEIPVAAGTNFTNRLITNVGNVENTGVELAISATPISNDDFSWEISGNFTLEKSIITKLTAIDDPEYLGVQYGGIPGIGNTIQIHSVNQPIGSFFAYEQIYDASGNPIEGQYTDVDSSGTGGSGNGDRIHYKNANPRSYLGINSRVSYKNFELSFSGRAKFGAYIYNSILAENTNYTRIKGNTPYLTNVHSEINTLKFEGPQLLSNHFIENGSFFRLDYINLAYNFTKIGKLSSLKVFATVQNVLTITNFSGLDPEGGAINGSPYPRSRTIMFGVSAGL